MPHKDSLDFRPPKESHPGWIILIIVVLIALGAAWWFWWRPAHAPVPEAATPTTESSAQATEPATAELPTQSGTVTQPEPESSGPQNPVDTLGQPEAGLPPLAESDQRVFQALKDLLNAPRLQDLIEFDHFVRRAVATVDNLGRSFAPDSKWPVHPTPGRFTVAGPSDAQVIAPENAARYDAFVNFAASIPLGPAVKLYAQLYPLFQSAYEDLGYPDGYFNDRLVAVLDLLLATPTPTGPVAVQVTPFKGESESTRPWTRYDYADPALESLSSGQKILIRMGPDNERRMKAVLADLRHRVATGAVAHPNGK